jgi:ankyrin repeat protein
MKLHYFLLIHFLFAAVIQAMEPDNNALHAMEPIKPEAGYSSDESSFEEGRDYFAEDFEIAAPTTAAKRSREDLAQQDNSKKQKIVQLFECLMHDELDFLKDHAGQIHSHQDTLDLLLHHALIKNNPKRLDFFLQRGANPNVMIAWPTRELEAPILVAALEKNKLEIADILFKHGTDINKKYVSSQFGEGIEAYTPIMAMKTEKYLPGLKWLIAHNADLNAVDASDNDVLQHMLSANNFPAFRLLCHHGASMNRQTISDDSTLCRVIHHGRWHFSRTDEMLMQYALCMLERGADVNIRAGDPITTPLIIACHYDDIDMIQLLLHYGADRSMKNEEGKTALNVLKEWLDADEDLDTVQKNTIQKLLTSQQRPPLPESALQLLKEDRIFTLNEARSGKNIAQIVAQRCLGKNIPSKLHTSSQPQDVPCYFGRTRKAFVQSEG